MTTEDTALVLAQLEVIDPEPIRAHMRRAFAAAGASHAMLIGLTSTQVQATLAQQQLEQMRQRVNALAEAMELRLADGIRCVGTEFIARELRHVGS